MGHTDTTYQTVYQVLGTGVSKLVHCTRYTIYSADRCVNVLFTGNLENNGGNNTGKGVVADMQQTELWTASATT